MVASQDNGKIASALSADTSVTQWIAGLKAGEAKAADCLWHRYFNRLVHLARGKLGSAPRRVADEEDVAAIVFCNLWQGAVSGHFPELRNRENLWPLLVVLTSRRVHDLLRHQMRRGDDFAPDKLDHVIAEEPTPEFVAMASENVSRLFALLDPLEKKIAQSKLEGLENTEIARELGCSLRTVVRKLHIIRQIWDENP